MKDLAQRKPLGCVFNRRRRLLPHYRKDRDRNGIYFIITDSRIFIILHHSVTTLHYHWVLFILTLLADTLYNDHHPSVLKSIGSFKQPRRQRQRKRHLKIEFAPLNFSSVILFHSIFQVSNFSGVDSKGLYLSSEKEEKELLSCVHVLHKM